MNLLKRILFVLLLCSCGLFAQDNYKDYSENLVPVNIEETSDRDTAVVIESSQPKMEVYLNGVYQGKTRLKISGLLPGDYIIELRKKNNSVAKAIITVRRGFILTYRFE